METKQILLLEFEYLGNRIIVPRLDDYWNPDKTQTRDIYKAIFDSTDEWITRKKSSFKIIEIEKELTDFNEKFFVENPKRSIQYLTIHEQDFGNLKTISTPYGDEVLPTERFYNIPVVVIMGRNQNIDPSRKDNLPILKLIKPALSQNEG